MKLLWHTDISCFKISELYSSVHSEAESRHKQIPGFVSQLCFFFPYSFQFIFNFCTEVASVKNAYFAN